MKVFTIVSTLALFASSALGITVSYDTTYDNSGQSLATVSCSDGPNSPLLIVMLEAFSAFRTYALANRSVYLSTLVFILCATFIVPDVVGFALILS